MWVLAFLLSFVDPKWKAIFPDTEISHQEPFSGLVGRDFQVTGEVTAHFWNDFPDKQRILTVTLYSSFGAQNRFVSAKVPVPRGQRIRILSAWKYQGLFEIVRWYSVEVPGAHYPRGVPIQIPIEADGALDPRYYAPIGS